MRQLLSIPLVVATLALASCSGVSDGRSQPVRVRLQRINCDFAKVHPADGEGKLWWARLNKALGTSSSAFVNASLFQLKGAARLPGGGISEVALNAALALIQAVAPKDEVEAALAVQMAATHSAAMTVLVRLGGGHGGERRVAALGSAAARLMRAYTHQVETLRRLRHGGAQLIRIERVDVNDGGQAIIGNVRAGSKGESE